MTREEEIKQASREFGIWKAGDAMFQLGAEWADKHPRKRLVDIEKVSKWLVNSIFYVKYLPNSNTLTINVEKLINDFRKAMEE